MTFFDGPGALEALSQRADPLQRLSEPVNFESFRGELERALYKPTKGPGGRAAVADVQDARPATAV